MVSAQPGLVIGIVESHEPLSRALAALILIELGTQIVGGRNEQEFIDKLDGRQPQVVLIGDDPAKADGTGKIISWVSNLFPHCHAVVVCEPNAAADKDFSGATAIVTRPVDAVQLIAKLSELLALELPRPQYDVLRATET